MKKYLILLIILLGNADFLLSQVHFDKVWTGNGLDQMNFYLSATLNGVNLENGDEIAVFDATYCVGVVVYSSSSISLKASKDDPTTPSIVDGFRDGNAFTFSIWDASEGVEISNIPYSIISGNSTFASSGTCFLTLTACTAPATPVVSVAQPTCGLTTGTITVSSPVGSGISYSIDGINYSNTNGIFTNVQNGNYTVTARRLGSCVSVGTNVTINANPLPATPSISVTQPACGTNTGAISVNSPKGSGLSYSINGTDYSNTDGIFTAVAVGNYNVTVRNAGGCTSASTGASINSNPLPATPTINVTQPTCGSTTGIITITAPTGSGFTYSINGSTYTNTNGIFTSVSTGSYTVTAKNANGCISSGTSVTLNANPLPSTPTLSVTQPACGATTGSIVVNSPTGSGYSYSIDGSNYSNTSGDFTSVAIGNYTVTAKNANGCISAGANALINANAIPSAPIVSVTEPVCGGTTGTLTVTSPTGSGLTYSINGTDYSNTSGVFTSVAVGNYNVTVKNAGGCISASTSASINSNPLPAIPTVNVMQPACGSTTGIITITAPTGSGFTYSINGSTYTNTNGIFTSVSTGSYTVTAKNANGCISSGTSVTLNANPLPSTPTLSVTQPACGATTGSIVVNSPTGSGYSYSIDGNDYTNISGNFASVAIGNYTITAKNVNGCISTGANASINAITAPSVPVVSVTEPVCGGTTGTLTVTSPTGSGLTYSINGTDYSNTSGVFTSVAIGNYNVTVKNAGECISASTSASINSNPLPATPTINVTQPTCGSTTGNITITAPTGSGFTYSINGSTYTNTNGIFTSVSTGSYIVTAKNANGCISSGISATLNANPLPSSPVITIDQPSCGASTGAITVNAPKGAGMTYSIDGINYTNTTGIFAGISTGTYNVTVKNSDGCVSSPANATINTNPLPETPTVEVTQPICGSATGGIKVTTPVGSGYSYSINGVSYSNNTGIFNNVTIGNYTVTVKNANGCISIGSSAIINSNPLPSTPVLSVSQPVCGATTGSIVVNSPTGAGYSYSVDGNDYSNTLGNFSTLVIGSYTVTAKNANGCISSGANALINANPIPSSPTVSVTEPSCGAITGALTVTSPTGIGFSYNIDGSDYSNTNGIFTGVSIGTHNIKVKSINGCISVTTDAVVHANPLPEKPVVTVTQPTCGTLTGTITVSSPLEPDYAYSINGLVYTNTTGVFNGVTVGNYTVTVKNSKGCVSSGTGTSINSNLLPLAPNVSITDPGCGSTTGTIVINSPGGLGYSYSIDGIHYSNTDGLFANVPAGIYMITAKNGNGCISPVTNREIHNNPLPEAPTVYYTQPTCLVATGSIHISAPIEAGMTYSIDGLHYTNTNGTFTNILSNTYKVTAKNANGCISVETTVVIAKNPGPDAPILSVTQPICGSSKGTITITAPSGSNLNYSINGIDYSNATGIFESVENGTYLVSVRNADGCISSETEAVIHEMPIPIAPVLSVTQPECGVTIGTIAVTSPLDNGLTYAIDGNDYTNATGTFSEIGIGLHTVTVKNNVGCISPATNVKIIANPLPDEPVVSIVQPECGSSLGDITINSPNGDGMTFSLNGADYTNTIGLFTNVTSGTYIVTAKNSNGCVSKGIETKIIDNPNPMQPVVNIIPPACGETKGGISIVTPTGSGLTFSIDGSDYMNTTGSFNGIEVGKYNVTVKNANGCISDETEVEVLENPLPVKPELIVAQPIGSSLTGQITVTGSIVTGLTFSIDGLNYTNTSGIFTDLTVGTYVVTSKNKAGCISDGAEAIIKTNTIAKAPELMIVQPSCQNPTGIVTVTSPTGSGITYSIDGVNYTNSTGLFTGLASGTYVITAKNSDGFISAGTSITINVQPSTPDQPGVITGEVLICENALSTYHIPEVQNATSYTWTLPAGWGGSSTTTTITVTPGATSGQIMVSATNECGSGVVQILNITITPTPPTPVITLNGRNFNSSATDGNQWYNNGPITGATNQDYTASVNGDYYTIVTLNGCSSAHSNIIKLVLTGIETAGTDNLIHVFPNPVQDELTIEYPDNNVKTVFEIVNTLGKVIYSGSMTDKAFINMSSLTPGIYFVKIMDNDSNIIKKIVKE